MNPKNVYLIRPDNLGDLVLFSGTLKHFRSLYPKAEISLYIKHHLNNLFEYCPYVDNLEDWENLSSVPINWIPEFRGKYRFNWLLRYCLNIRKKVDLLLLPVRSSKSKIFGMQEIVHTIRANEKIGISGDFSNQSENENKKGARYFTKRMELTSSKKDEHELSINYEFLKYLGMEIQKKDIWPEFWTTDMDRHWANASIPSNSKNIRLAICPGVTSLPGKFYSGQNYAKAISSLKDMEFEVIIFGDQESKYMCQEVDQNIKNCPNVKSILNMCGKTTIRQMIEGLKKCHIVISQETGALHVAVALNKPTIGITGGGHYGRFYPWGNEKINLVAHKKNGLLWL